MIRTSPGLPEPAPGRIWHFREVARMCWHAGSGSRVIGFSMAKGGDLGYVLIACDRCDVRSTASWELQYLGEF